uniref:HD antigen n=1 Tax=Hepatitis delta virus TaxID=12475 RepID=A0A4P2VEU2_HDV|nr:HD antigen [Hepatitis delta virus]
MSRSESKKSRGGREEVLEQWVNGRKKLEELERDLRKVKKKIKKLEDDNPWLGNIKGILGKKDKDGEGAPPAKRARTDQMEVDSGPRRRPLRGGFTDKERQDHRRRKALENKKKQLDAGGKKLSREEEEELKRLTEEDERRERRVAGPQVGGVNPLEGGSRGAPGGGFLPQHAGSPGVPLHQDRGGAGPERRTGIPMGYTLPSRSSLFSPKLSTPVNKAGFHSRVCVSRPSFLFGSAWHLHLLAVRPGHPKEDERPLGWLRESQFSLDSLWESREISGSHSPLPRDGPLGMLPSRRQRGGWDHAGHQVRKDGTRTPQRVGSQAIPGRH